MSHVAKEPRLRSIVKTLSWRVVATLITMFVAFIITGEGALALEIGIADTLIKLFAYYGHERAWAHLKFKRAEPPEYQI